MAVPFVASLQTTTAYANTSAYGCAEDANNKADPMTQTGLVDTQDGLVRVPITGFLFGSGNSEVRFWDVTQKLTNIYDLKVGDVLYSDPAEPTPSASI